METSLLKGSHIGGYLGPQPRHTWWSQTERQSMGSPMVDSRWELTPSVRFPWLGAAQAGQVDTHCSHSWVRPHDTGCPDSAASKVDRWVHPWSTLGGSWHPASGYCTHPYPTEPHTLNRHNGLSHWSGDDGAVRDIRGTPDSRLTRFSPG